MERRDLDQMAGDLLRGLEDLLADGDGCLPPRVKRRVETLLQIACALKRKRPAASAFGHESPAVTSQPAQTGSVVLIAGPRPNTPPPAAFASAPPQRIPPAKMPRPKRRPLAVAVRPVWRATLAVSRFLEAASKHVPHRLPHWNWRELAGRLRRTPAPLPPDLGMFRAFQPSGSLPLASGLSSLALHAAAVAGLLALSPAIVKHAEKVHAFIWLTPAEPPSQTPAPLPKPKLRQHLPTPPPDANLPALAPRALLLEPKVDAPPEVRLTPPRITTPPPPIPVSVPPPQAPIQTNVFPQVTASALPDSAPITVKSAGFDRTPKLELPAGPGSGPVQRAGFDPSSQPALPTQSSGTVRTGAFAALRPAGGSKAGVPGGSARTGVFGSAAPQHAPAPVPVGTPSRTAFDRPQVEPRPPERSVAPVAPKRVAVEILDKPRPRYTPEAQKAHVEGTVYLDVTFTADGKVVVHRVRKGLGYGLDQAAIDAAHQMRFAPAKVDGTAVDQTAVLQVEFQISQ